MTRLKDTNGWKASKALFWLIVGIMTFLFGVHIIELETTLSTWYFIIIGFFFVVIGFLTGKDAVKQLENIDF